MFRFSKQGAIDYLLKTYNRFNKLENNPMDQGIKSVEIKAITYSKSELASILEIENSQVEEYVAQMEEEGEYFVRNNANHYTIDTEQAAQLSELAGNKSIQTLRKEGRKYVVPVIIINIGKGGVAKSTLAIHLAVEAALDFKQNQRVFLFDLDPQGSIIKQLSPLEAGAKYETLLKLIEDHAHLEREERLSPEYQAKFRDIILNEIAIPTHIDNLTIIPADSDDTAIELKLQKVLGMKGPEIAITAFKDLIITPLENDADMIILDTSPSTNVSINNFYFAANHVQFCTTGRKQDYRSYVAHHKYVADVLADAPNDFAGYFSIKTVVTKHIDNKTKQSKAMSVNVDRINSVSDVHRQVIHENAKYEEASALKRPLQLFTAKSNDTLYTNAIKEIKTLYGQFKTNINEHLFQE